MGGRAEEAEALRALQSLSCPPTEVDNISFSIFEDVPKRLGLGDVVEARQATRKSHKTFVRTKQCRLVADTVLGIAQQLESQAGPLRLRDRVPLAWEIWEGQHHQSAKKGQLW